MSRACPRDESRAMTVSICRRHLRTSAPLGFRPSRAMNNGRVLAWGARPPLENRDNRINYARNLHPSLLPLFKGAHAIKESFDSDMKVGGVSVHWVSEELDGGKIIAQRAFEKSARMSLEEFEAKIHAIEHEILPETIVQILTDKE